MWMTGLLSFVFVHMGSCFLLLLTYRFMLENVQHVSCAQNILGPIILSPVAKESSGFQNQYFGTIVLV